MMDAVVGKMIEQLNTSVFVLIAILCVSFWIVYRVGKWTETFSNHSKKIESSEINHQSLYQSIAHITAKVDLIYCNTLKNPVVMARSPVSLTETGIQANGVIGLDAVLQREFSKLEGLVGKNIPTTSYDIQTESMRVADKCFTQLLTDAELNRAKDFAFKTGLRLEDLSSILGVLLQNELLKQRNICL